MRELMNNVVIVGGWDEVGVDGGEEGIEGGK